MPTLIWYGLNVFRLVAVTFMSWALVAVTSRVGKRSITLWVSLTDISEVNFVTGQHNTNSASMTSTAPPITLWGVGGAITISPTPTILAALSPTSSSASPVTMPVVPAMPDIPEEPTPTIAAPRQTTPAAQVKEIPAAVKPLVPLGDLKRRHNVRRLTYQRRADSVPVASTDPKVQIEGIERSDLIAWVAISRLLIAGLLSVATVVQVGAPEMFLYNHLSWLGPQSTPLTLGALQAFCSVEILRNRAKDLNLIPAHALLAIGGLNIMIGLTLIYLGRNLPKIPPPPLYFNHATRLPFWKPDPPCYRQLYQPRLPTHTADHACEGSSEGRVRSNAHEIGLDSSDEEEKQYEAPRVIPGARAMTAVEDVSRGGYPTFAGSGIGQPGRNVPAGRIEMDQWGAPMGLTREEDARRDRTGEEIQDGRHETLRRPKPRRYHPPSLHLQRPKPRRYHPPSLHLQREAAQDSLFSAIQADLAGSPRSQDPVSRSGKKKRMPSVPDRSDLQRIPSTTSENSAYGGISRAGKTTYRKSIDQAARDFGPHFPLPPSRNKSSEIKPDAPKDIKAQKGRRPPSAYLARGPLSPSKTVRSPMNTHFRPPPPRSATVEAQSIEMIDDDHEESSPKTPGTAKTPLSTPSPISAQIAHAQHDQVVAGQVYRRQMSANREPLTPEKVESVKPVKARSRSVSVPPRNAKPPISSIKRSTSVHVNQAPKGVRVDLSTVEEEPEEVPKTAPPGGLRIPGTNFHIPLPAILSPAPARRQSLSSVSDSRPVSSVSLTGMMEKLEQEMLSDAKRMKEADKAKPKVLGDKYLIGEAKE